MKFFRIHPPLFITAIAIVLTVALVAVTTGRGQSQEALAKPIPGSTKSQVKTTGMVRERRSEPVAVALPPASMAAMAAAALNASLRTDLSWVFGKKPQRGWYLYTPLISRLLRTNQDPNSGDFAAAVIQWQQRSGLKGNGVIDEDSLYAMISEWQGRRLKDRTPASSDQLLVAPASDFFDPERVDELRQVEHQTYDAYKRMVSAALADPSLGLKGDSNGGLDSSEKYLKILSAFRSREYQEKLRRESPSAGSAGLAVNSPHFTGRALDLYVGGEPVETNDANRKIQVETPVYKWLVANASRFGFQPYFYEPWHWEYVGEN